MLNVTFLISTTQAAKYPPLNTFYQYSKIWNFKFLLVCNFLRYDVLHGGVGSSVKASPSPLILGEKLMLQGWSGVVLHVTGIALDVTHPVDKVELSTGSDKRASSIGKLAPPPCANWIASCTLIVCRLAFLHENVFYTNQLEWYSKALVARVLAFYVSFFSLSRHCSEHSCLQNRVTRTFLQRQ